MELPPNCAVQRRAVDGGAVARVQQNAEQIQAPEQGTPAPRPLRLRCISTTLPPLLQCTTGTSAPRQSRYTAT